MLSNLRRNLLLSSLVLLGALTVVEAQPASMVATGIGSPGYSADEEILKEFKKYFKKYKDSASRVEAIRALEGTESVGVVKILMPLLRDEDPEVVRASVGILSAFETRPPVDEMLQRLEKDKNTETRVGLLRILERGEYKGTGEIVSVCLEDKSWMVRRHAIKSLAAGSETDHLEAIEALREDKEGAVRCASLEAMLALKSAQIVPYSIAALQDESWQVRSAAIQSLGSVRHLDSIQPLIGQMHLEEGRLLADAAHALENITGRAFGERVELWQRFLDNYKGRYKIPTDEEMVKLREMQAKRRAEYEKRGGLSNYHGIATPSRSLLFVIDVSGSMEHEVREKERFKDGDYPSMSRMDIVKTELARTVVNLESHVDFNILS
ncbi:MAG: HEAT repeat protein, partial [Planctomycetota bacterium]